MNRKTYMLLPLLFVSIFSNLSSYGWGKEGHRMVGEVAATYMNKTTLDMVNKYLNGISIDSASTWMDDVRSVPEYKHMASWHFINIEKGKEYVPNPKEENCINEINKAYKNLKNRNKLSDDEIRKNLMILFHLWGDLHQPLHTGYSSDKGGNGVDVHFHGTTNLHSLWDGGMIKDKKVKLANCVALYKTLSKTELAELKKFDNVAALKESRSYLTQVYDFQNGTIDAAYEAKGIPVIEKQILCGGLRLAAMLDDIFKK